MNDVLVYDVLCTRHFVVFDSFHLFLIRYTSFCFMSLPIENSKTKTNKTKHDGRRGRVILKEFVKKSLSSCL